MGYPGIFVAEINGDLRAGQHRDRIQIIADVLGNQIDGHAASGLYVKSEAGACQSTLNERLL